MIQLQITGRHFELDRKVNDYINKKIGLLDKYAKGAEPALGTVVLHLKESNTENSSCECEVNLDLGKQTFHAKEATLNMYAAIDICEAKLKAQILKDKDKHQPGRNRRRLLFGKMFGRDVVTNPDLTEE
jgi:ribosomal subunit interface protein